MSDKPLHVFVIPDGNRRWGRASIGRGSLLPHGHRAGYEVFKHMTRHIWELGVTDFTFWALSIDNFQKRRKQEVDALLELLRRGVTELREMLEKEERKIKFQVVGDTAFRIPWQTLREMDQLENDTKCNSNGTLTLLVAYDGIWDLTTAFERGRSSGHSITGISYEAFRSLLPSERIPSVDLMVRTGGEPHLSGAALPLQMADAHIHFSDILWPDFTMQDLATIIADFKKHSRRLGA